MNTIRKLTALLLVFGALFNPLSLSANVFPVTRATPDDNANLNISLKANTSFLISHFVIGLTNVPIVSSASEVASFGYEIWLKHTPASLVIPDDINIAGDKI